MEVKKPQVIRRRYADLNVEKKVDCEEVKTEIADILQRILKQLFRHADEVEVSVIQGEKTTIFEIDLAPGDFGRLLGAKGKNIEALRTVFTSLTASKGFRSVIRVKDEQRFFKRDG